MLPAAMPLSLTQWSVIIISSLYSHSKVLTVQIKCITKPFCLAVHSSYKVSNIIQKETADTWAVLFIYVGCQNNLKLFSDGHGR